MAFAGLSRTWTRPPSAEMETAAIVTTDAPGAMGAVRARAPVMVPPDGFADFWLDCGNVRQAEEPSLCSPRARPRPANARGTRSRRRWIAAADNSPQLLEPYNTGAEPVEQPPQKPGPEALWPWIRRGRDS